MAASGKRLLGFGGWMLLWCCFGLLLLLSGLAGSVAAVQLGVLLQLAVGCAAAAVLMGNSVCRL